MNWLALYFVVGFIVAAARWRKAWANPSHPIWVTENNLRRVYSSTFVTVFMFLTLPIAFVVDCLIWPGPAFFQAKRHLTFDWPNHVVPGAWLFVIRRTKRCEHHPPVGRLSPIGERPERVRRILFSNPCDCDAPMFTVVRILGITFRG
jgi:hypothetical protein